MSEALVKAEAVDRLAEKVAELLEPRLIEALEARLSAEVDAPRLVDAHKVADALGLTRATVYAMADELGAIRVGDGQKPRLRFDLERARSAWSARAEDAEVRTPPQRRPGQPRTRARGELLPVRGRTP
ncbi:hypothetical protein BH24ACT25_BH24ACT25_04740 [soil metagenome]